MGGDKKTHMLKQAAGFFSEKYLSHGDTAKGVDWNGEESQTTRFDQLIKIFNVDEHEHFSINDLGCGYGALYDYIKDTYPNLTYYGYDISETMISKAKTRHAQYPQAQYKVASEPSEVADYGVESGIFNLSFGYDDAEWQTHIEATLDVLDRTSRRGFAFNCLTSYSDADKMKPELYYADPCRLFDYCKRKYSRNVALLHDYGLYDFTILVRKDR